MFFKVNIKEKVNEEYQKIIGMINNAKIISNFILIFKLLAENINYVYKNKASIICCYVKTKLNFQKHVLNNLCAMCVVSDLQMELIVDLRIRKYWNNLFASFLINDNVGKEYGICFDREIRLGKDNNKRFDFVGKTTKDFKYIIAVEIDDASHGKLEKSNLNDKKKNAICNSENIFLVRIDFRSMKYSEHYCSVFVRAMENFNKILSECLVKI
jgi:hypothetical protein